MKTPMTKRRRRGMTRREFVGRTLTVAGALTGAPAILRGRGLNGKLDIAFIACGGRALTNIGELIITPGRNVAATHPDENVVVLCDVNQNALDAASARFPKAKTFTDLRRVFDRPNDFDAVVVSTAEHTHAFAT